MSIVSKVRLALREEDETLREFGVMITGWDHREQRVGKYYADFENICDLHELRFNLEGNFGQDCTWLVGTSERVTRKEASKLLTAEERDFLTYTDTKTGRYMTFASKAAALADV